MNIDTLLSAALKNRDTFDYLREALTSDLVIANPFQLQIARFASSFIDNHHTLPLPGDWELWITGLGEAQSAGVKQTLGTLHGIDTSSYTDSFLSEKAIDAMREIAAGNALSRMNALDGRPPPDLLAKLADDVNAIRPVGIADIGRLEDVGAWMAREEVGDRIGTGYPRLDRLLGGGWDKELVFILADAGVGKTTMLIQHGYHAASHGAHVLHVTMELSLRNTIHRYYRRIAESERRKFRTDRKIVEGRLHRWLRLALGEVSVVFAEPYTLGVEELRVLVRTYQRIYGEIDMLILDYLDLMKPADTRDEYKSLGRLSHSVRGMAVREFDCTVLSATQATRDTRSKPRKSLRLSDMGDSIHKVRAGDIIIGLVQSEEEAEYYQARYQVLKVRESGGRGGQVLLFYYLDRMFIAELDPEAGKTPHTKRVMEELGIPVADLTEEKK